MRRHLLALLAGLLLVAGSPLLLAAAPLAPPAEAKTWGDDPLTNALAAAANYDGPCANGNSGLSQAQLAAAMLAPSWPETGAPDNLAPSPMTMSRWDDSPRLWAFGDPGTAFRRAFWHPGVGLWQFDSAGLGAPYSASQRIDTRVIATPMAQEISARYCRATGTGAERLAYAWTPWHGCNGGRCFTIYAAIYSNGALRNLVRDPGVLSTGGMQARTCRGPGTSGTFSCWRVDPSLAQGYGAGGVGWAAPDFGTAPVPITAPFFVYVAGGYEYRHWLKVDTGYNTGVWARRPLGQNARSSVEWHGGESLCDVTTGDGACCPTLTARYDCVAVTVGGSYTPVVGDFNGDRVDDVLWYAPGTAADYLWQGTVYGRFISRGISVGGSNYRPVAGDFDHNGTDDILWYQPGGQDRLWRGKRNGSFVGQSINVGAGDYQPVSEDFNGDRHADILWYQSGTAPDYVWYGTASGFTNKAFTQDGEGLIPLAANYDGDERADIFWYGPGTVGDKLWFGTVGRRFSVNIQTQITGTYVPVAGRLNRGRRADILWYQPGGASDVLYLGAPGRSFDGRSVDIDEEFQPFVGDFNGNGVQDVFWYGPGSGRDAITLGG